MKSYIFFSKFFILILYCKIVLSNYLPVEEASTCKVFESSSHLVDLKMYVFCNYEEEIRPSKQNQNTTVGLVLMPKFMDFESGMNKFTLNSWLKVGWKDDRLKWNPKDFDNLTELRVKSDDIWVPDLSLWNSADLDSDLIFALTAPCVLSYTGLVICVPMVETTVHCSSDYENWPFEKQICQLDFSSYFHYSEEINLKLWQQRYDLKSESSEIFMHHQEWSVINITASEIPDYIRPIIKYEFQLKRHAGIMLTLYFVPGIGMKREDIYNIVYFFLALMMLTLVILWMDVNSVERISLGSLNFICHLFCLYDLNWQISANGRKIPYILFFYQNSLALAAFSLILTVLLRNLQAMTISSPKWISSIGFFVLRYRIGRLFILNDEETKCFVGIEEDADDNVESMQSVTTTIKNEDIWRRFAKIVECLSFFSVLFTYIIMLLPFISMK